MKFDFDRKIIFVGGVHGVGKTTLCRNISERLCIKHYSASQLISNLDSADKNVKNIKKNQDSLLESVNKYLNDEEYYILDGHFCLLNTNGVITKVPLDTFKSLGLKTIIVLVDDEQKILRRLADRDMKDYSIDLIKEFQKEEICHAEDVARDIKVKIKIIKVTSESDEMQIFINNIINE